MDRYEALERLSRLKAEGVLSEDEFVAEKAKLLAAQDRAQSAMLPLVAAPPLWHRVGRGLRRR